MTQQTFFGDEQPLLTHEVETDSGTTPKKRVFSYNGQLFEDPGPEYSIGDILNFLSSTYPELASGSWTSRTLPDGTEEITFVKVTGDKG